MNTLIIEPTTKVDYQLFVGLAKRLNVIFREEKPIKTKAKNEATFYALAGSFEDIGAEAMIKDIEESRTTKDIDFSWVK
jgi:hypothetical protein